MVVLPPVNFISLKGFAIGFARDWFDGRPASGFLAS